LAPQVGLEPTTLRLTAECSAIELLRSVDDQLSNLSAWQTREDFTPAEKAALRLAETVTLDANSLSDEQFAELQSFFSDGEIVELLCSIGLFNYFNRFNNALRMEPTKVGEGGCETPTSLSNSAPKPTAAGASC
jgi:hypothetical protein